MPKEAIDSTELASSFTSCNVWRGERRVDDDKAFLEGVAETEDQVSGKAGSER